MNKIKNTIRIVLVLTWATLNGMEQAEQRRLLMQNECEKTIEDSIQKTIKARSAQLQTNPSLGTCLSTIQYTQETDEHGNVYRRPHVAPLADSLITSFHKDIARNKDDLFKSLEKQHGAAFGGIQETLSRYYDETAQQYSPNSRNNGSLTLFDETTQEFAHKLINRNNNEEQLNAFKTLLNQQINSRETNPDSLYAAAFACDIMFRDHVLPPAVFAQKNRTPIKEPTESEFKHQAELNNTFWDSTLRIFGPAFETLSAKDPLCYKKINGTLSGLFWTHRILKTIPDALCDLKQKHPHTKAYEKETIPLKTTVRNQCLRYSCSIYLLNYALWKFDHFAHAYEPLNNHIKKN